jgi:hypothetical protein
MGLTGDESCMAALHMQVITGRESLSAGGANKLWVGFKKQDVRQTQAGWS